MSPEAKVFGTTGIVNAKFVNNGSPYMIVANHGFVVGRIAAFESEPKAWEVMGGTLE